MVWPDGTTLQLALPRPYHSSKDAKIWAFIQTARYVQSIGASGRVFLCVDNSQVVQKMDAFISNTPLCHS